jgi:hydrogenase maturation protein HypF
MLSVRLPFKTDKPVLACGADMKGAFALAKGDKAFLFDGFGDLGDPGNLARYEAAIKRNAGMRPAVIACDLHPGYFSSRFAKDYTLYAARYTLYEIQHHEAHVASAIVDNSLKSGAIGVAFDGTGFGADGNIWGGEFFTGGLGRLTRAAHLDYIPMPGGEAAVREPWRMALSWLYRVFGERFLDLKTGLVKKLDRKKWPVLKKMMDKDINSPLTSSAGRLFDAAGALILSKEKATFEAELPIELEKMALAGCDDSYESDVRPKDGMLIADPSKIIRGIVKDLSAGVEGPVISAKFHNGVARMVLKVCVGLRKKSGVRKAVLSGGVFQNRYLRDRTAVLLEEDGFAVFTHSKVPVNDSGIPIGQIAITKARSMGCA